VKISIPIYSRIEIKRDDSYSKRDRNYNSISEKRDKTAQFLFKVSIEKQKYPGRKMYLTGIKEK
jgi:hypothetical protein